MMQMKTDNSDNTNTFSPPCSPIAAVQPTMNVLLIHKHSIMNLYSKITFSVAYDINHNENLNTYV